MNIGTIYGSGFGLKHAYLVCEQESKNKVR
jgi:hypothetical protein